jgi:MoaA/NifB/PqqE/SkfB family radical SAM enzyme
MTAEQWCDVLHELGRLGTMRVKFQGGEPTLHPDFRELTKAARDAGMITATVTNGSVVARKPELLDYLEEIVVSLDSLRPEVHDGLRGAGSFEAATGAIEVALERRIRTYVNMALTQENVSDLEAMLAFCESQGMKMNAQPIKFGLDYYDDEARKIALTPEQIRGVHRQLAEWSRQGRSVMFSPWSYSRVLSWPDTSLNTIQSEEYSKCVAGSFSIHIDPNGDIVPCIPAMNSLAPKNILKDGLHEALRQARNHKCADCWSAYLNERKLLFKLRPAALLGFFRRG